MSSFNCLALVLASSLQWVTMMITMAMAMTVMNNDDDDFLTVDKDDNDDG